MLTNFLQMKSVICISANSCHEYTFCVLNKLQLSKQQCPGSWEYLRSNTALWMNCRIRYHFQIQSAGLGLTYVVGREENVQDFLL